MNESLCYCTSKAILKKKILCNKNLNINRRMYQEAKFCQYPSFFFPNILLIAWWPQWRQLKSEVLQSAVSASTENLLKCRLSGPTPDLPRQNLHFFKIPRWSVCTLGLKKLWVQWESSWVLNGIHHHQLTLLVCPALAPVLGKHTHFAVSHTATQVVQMTSQVPLEGLHAVKEISKGGQGRGASVTESNSSVYCDDCLWLEGFELSVWSASSGSPHQSAHPLLTPYLA